MHSSAGEWQRQRFLSLDPETLDLSTGALDHTMPMGAAAGNAFLNANLGNSDIHWKAQTGDMIVDSNTSAMLGGMVSVDDKVPKRNRLPTPGNQGEQGAAVAEIEALSRIIEQDETANVVGLPAYMNTQLGAPGTTSISANIGSLSMPPYIMQQFPWSTTGGAANAPNPMQTNHRQTTSSSSSSSATVNASAEALSPVGLESTLVTTSVQADESWQTAQNPLKVPVSAAEMERDEVASWIYVPDATKDMSRLSGEDSFLNACLFPPQQPISVETHVSSQVRVGKQRAHTSKPSFSEPAFHRNTDNQISSRSISSSSTAPEPLPIKVNLDPHTRTKSAPGASLETLQKHGLDISNLDPVVVRRLRNTDSARRSRLRRQKRMEELEHRVEHLSHEQQCWVQDRHRLNAYKQWAVEVKQWLLDTGNLEFFETEVGWPADDI